MLFGGADKDEGERDDPGGEKDRVGEEVVGHGG
jgi:hypothetical protein